MNTPSKVALVTGASRGIGQAILWQLAENGITVIGTATTPEGVKRIEEQLQSKQYNGAALLLDVTQPDSIQTCLSSIKERFGAPSILVNNAGVTRDNLLMRMKEEEWDTVLQTNLTAIFRLSKEAMRDMMKARWGRIINIGSIVGTTGNPGQVNYAAAKAGLIGFSKSLAQEIASRGVTVNVVSPGFIQTDMTASLSEAQHEKLLASIPMGRMGTPDDIAATVAFLISDAASYITGQTIHVNGGMYMD